MKILKWLGILFGGLFALLLIAGVVLYFSIKPYLSSDSFRTLLETEVSKSLQVEVKFEPLQWSGLSVFTNSMKTIGESKVAIKALDAQQLRISIALRPLLQKIARVDRIEMQSLAVEFQVPEPQAQPPQTTEAPSTPPPVWIQSIAPQKVEIGEIVVQQGKLRWPAGENSFGQLSEFKVLASVDGEDFNLLVNEGKLEIPQLPLLKLKTLKGRAHQKNIFITAATLQYEDQGTFNLDGELGMEPKTTAHLNFEINRVPITPFLTGDWKARLLGNMNGKLKLTQDESTQGIPQVLGSVELTQGKIEALPIFNKIGEMTKILDSSQVDRWRSISLDRAKTNLNWTPQKMVLDQIDFESKKLLLLQGTIEIEGENIAGTTTLGTDPQLIKIVPGLIDQVFNQTVGEYAATPVILSGTKSDFKEDLTERLAMSAVSTLLQKLPEGMGDKVKNITDEIQQKVPAFKDLFKK